MLATVQSASVIGASGFPVSVEVYLSAGIPSFSIVGLPDEVCRESRDRVRAAVLSCDVAWPNQRITVNLAPSHLKKAGAALDLAIAVGVLVASEVVVPAAIERLAFVGELGLDGAIRAVPGVAPMVAAMVGLTGGLDIATPPGQPSPRSSSPPSRAPSRSSSPRSPSTSSCDEDATVGVADELPVAGDDPAAVPIAPVVPGANLLEARVATKTEPRVVDTLATLVRCLRGDEPWPDPPPPVVVPPPPPPPDLADVRGQQVARLALEVAAAGGHHLFLLGPPGAGKTMLAERLPGLLPDLDDATALEATMVRSAAGLGLPATGLVRQAPFRSPHHTTSMVALVGGGTHSMRPGEISLAHGGALFMDEMGEFPASVLDALRQPLEEGVIRIARARANATLPARFLLIGASNPCPCGGGPPGSCSCSESRRERYLRRLSGPLLDRFDLRVLVTRPPVDDLVAGGSAETSAVVAGRVAAARRVATERQGSLNARLSGAELDRWAPLTPAGAALLRHELEHDRLSGRGYHRVRRVARTLADLDAVRGDGRAAELIGEQHVAVALRLRASVSATTKGRAA